MFSNKKPFFYTLALLIFMLALAFATRLSVAQEQGTDNDVRTSDAVSFASDYIPIQGLLTDSGGTPLNGSYQVTFRIYDVGSGGTALCTSTRTLNLVDGLFNAYINGSSCSIDGRQLYLGIQVGTDPEMTPRSYIDNVPYAWSLRPGATIIGDSSDDILSVQNDGSGAAIIGRSVTPSVDGVGVTGTSLAGSGIKGMALTGIGVQGDSFSGVSIKATGTGIIQSEANSYIWASGNGVRPYHQSDSTVIDMTSIGGARISRGATPGYKNVMLPITVPGELYGQDVTVTDLDIYWVGDTDTEAITAVLLRRQTGVCGSSTCYQTILHNTTDYTCNEDTNATGCTLHFDLGTNNVLSSSSGILYLTIEMGFSGASSWIDIGGVRLTLAHE